MPVIKMGGEEFSVLALELLGSGNTLRFRAKGGSMRPFIRDGDLLEVEPVKIEDIHVGDILFCRVGEGRLIVHRVVSTHESGAQPSFVLQGDANYYPDGFITPEQVLGRVISLRRNGKPVQVDWNHQRSKKRWGRSPIQAFLGDKVVGLKRWCRSFIR